MMIVQRGAQHPAYCIGKGVFAFFVFLFVAVFVLILAQPYSQGDAF